MSTINPGKKLDSEYEPGPEDWRITLKVFNGDHEERRVLAFVGRSQVSAAGDRDLTADELEEDKGKDVTSCVDFNGEFPETDQGNVDKISNNVNFRIQNIPWEASRRGKNPKGEEVEAIRIEAGPRSEDRNPTPGQGETPVRPNHCLEAEKP